MLEAQAKQLHVLAPALSHADTLPLAQRFFQARDYSLRTLAEALELADRPDHRALADVRTTVGVLERIIPKLAEHEAARRDLIDRESEPFAELASLLEDWRQLARPADLLDQVLDESGLATYYASDEQRSISLRDLVRAFEQLDDHRRPPALALEQVMTQTALTRSLDRLGEIDDRVAIITIHQAKGLEFDAVFVAGLTEGELPRRRSIQEGRLEEERRLFYVALTRARQRLFLSTHALNEYGPTRPSQFLAQVGGSLVQEE
jgi:DNA helicase-2/ATP-dependent DNA helicase PcrA